VFAHYLQCACIGAEFVCVFYLLTTLRRRCGTCYSCQRPLRKQACLNPFGLYTGSDGRVYQDPGLGPIPPKPRVLTSSLASSSSLPLSVSSSSSWSSLSSKRTNKAGGPLRGVRTAFNFYQKPVGDAYISYTISMVDILCCVL
jgi:hypothetical protein